MESQFRGEVLIEVKNLSVEYDGSRALENISFRLKHPSLLVIIGPNGAGKTTLLKSLLGLVEYSGEIKIFGKEPEEARELIGYMPQRDRVNANIPLRVKDVLLMPLLSKKIIGIRKEDVNRAKDALRTVGLLHYWDRRFNALSGGEQQRVFLARTLAQNAKILILDEPFSATDVATKMKMINILHRLKQEKTIILVTHDVNPLVECTDNFLLLNKRMIAFGRVDEVIREETLERLYGVRVPVIRRENVCYVVGSDVHVHN
jgi:zinc/manganese transport system ATP-binding protein